MQVELLSTPPPTTTLSLGNANEYSEPTLKMIPGLLHGLHLILDIKKDSDGLVFTVETLVKLELLLALCENAFRCVKTVIGALICL